MTWLLSAWTRFQLVSSTFSLKFLKRRFDLLLLVSSLHPYLPEKEVLSLFLLLLLLIQLSGVQRLLFYDQPSQRSRLLCRHRWRWWRRRGELLVLLKFLFCFLRVTLVLPGWSWWTGVHSRGRVTGLGYDLGHKRRSIQVVLHGIAMNGDQISAACGFTILQTFPTRLQFTSISFTTWELPKSEDITFWS